MPREYKREGSGAISATSRGGIGIRGADSEFGIHE